MWCRMLNKSFCAALSLLLAACVRPGMSVCPEDYACGNADNDAPRLPPDPGTGEVIRTTAADPAINLRRTHLNLARTRLSLHPVTGAAAPAGPGNSESPANPALNSGARSP